jgi:HPt (histidine-containing phosphotransfer) domain-containing protein
MPAPDRTTPNPMLNDPEFAELIDYFRGELPARVRSLEEFAAAEDLGAIQRLAHQLKGAAPGFGFADVGQAAHRLEATMRAAESTDSTDSTERSLSRIRSDLDALVLLCRSYFPSNQA